MRIEKVEILSDVPNDTVVKLPWRNYPGLVIQGDTLFSLWKNCDDLVQKTKSMGSQEFKDDIEYLEETLKGHLEAYEAVILKAGYELPYSR